MLKALSGFCSAVALLAAQGAAAQSVNLTEDMAAAQVTIAGQTLEITRNQDEAAVLTGDFAKTSRACPNGLRRGRSRVRLPAVLHSAHGTGARRGNHR
jgi:hypothetical protein